MVNKSKRLRAGKWLVNRDRENFRDILTVEKIDHNATKTRSDVTVKYINGNHIGKSFRVSKEDLLRLWVPYEG